jgi:hypothetical protein
MKIEPYKQQTTYIDHIKSIEQASDMRKQEYANMDEHKKLRIVSYEKIDNESERRAEEYYEMIEEGKEFKQILVNQEVKQEDRIIKEIRRRDYFIELLRKGMRLDLIA